MYLGQLKAKVTIADKYVLNGVHSCEIKRSVHQIVQTAKIELPLSVVMQNYDLRKQINLSGLIKEGDSIKIEAGYDNVTRLEFEGYIKRINYTIPLSIECEDELYLFRKMNFKKSFNDAPLKDIIQYIIDELKKQMGLQLEVYKGMPEFPFKNFLMKNGNGIDVLQELKDKYGLNSYLISVDGVKTLYVGLMYGYKTTNVKYVFNRNTIATSDLKYNGFENRRYKATIKNFNPDGTTTTLETGDKDGEQTNVYWFGSHTIDELRHFAEAQIQMFGMPGYKGSIDTFLTPYVEPGMIANLSDPQFPDRDGNHYVGTVTTTIGSGGGRRKPEVDFKV
ncbi:MAG TPA: hypothetical protein PKM63_21920 [Panacibacter sp.]|nr:hypothetical protein [Panacibacter sp.]HNP46971.1 hypothetical protein [Panacibacter sp.]